MKLRPIVVGDTARRILVRAYDSKVKQDVHSICSSHQLNVLQGGYDVGIHAARAELKKCARNKNCVLKIDFKNAFNSIKRNFFLELIAAWLPQLLPSAWLFYSSPSKAYSNEGIEFSSEKGAQQGDHVGNIAFSMITKFINDQLGDLDFALKLFYVDDLLLIGNIETLTKALRIIGELEDLTGVRVNFSKTVLYCPDQENFKSAKDLFNEEIQIEHTLDIEYLKCPVGDDEFVKEYLDGKLTELKTTTKILSEMPYAHEAWTLLRFCGSNARITHLQRVLPPKQMKPFNKEYDNLIRDAYCKILGVRHFPDWSWNIQKLPPRLGGVMLRTGLGLSATN